MSNIITLGETYSIENSDDNNGGVVFAATGVALAYINTKEAGFTTPLLLKELKESEVPASTPGTIYLYIKEGGSLETVNSSGDSAPVSNLTGPTGFSGSSGSQGVTGYTGYTGMSGQSGIQGMSGQSGIQGITGYTGMSGLIGPTGVPGNATNTGSTGMSGIQGMSGKSGIQGPTGYTGQSGIRGLTGMSGQSGIQGQTGQSGTKGVTGYTGSRGGGVNASIYKFSTNTSDSDPGNGKFRLNNSTQNSSTQIYVDDQTDNGTNIRAFLLALGTSTSKVYIQEENNPDRFKFFFVNQNAEGDTGYVRFPSVSYIDGGNDIRNNRSTIFTIGSENGNTGVRGQSGIQGPTGYTGLQGPTGYTGLQGQTGIQGPTGLSGIQGLQGFTGLTGQSGIQGVTGQSGIQAIQGHTGKSGIAGITGPDGPEATADFGNMYGTSGNIGPLNTSTYVGWTTATQGLLNNLIFNDNVTADNLEIVKSSTYNLIVTASVNSNLTDTIEFAVFINGTKNTALIASRSFVAGTAGTITITGLINSTSGDTFDLRCISSNSTPIIIIQNIQFTIVRTTGGAIGPTGSPGAATNTGSSGPTGPQGFTGAAGVAANTGASGPTGPLGPTGALNQTYFNAYASTAGPIFDATAQTISINTIRESTGQFSLTAGEITVNEDGVYSIVGRTTVEQTGGSQRTTSFMFLEIDTGGGFVTVPGTYNAQYSRQTTAGETSGGFNCILSLSNGHKIRMRIQELTSSGAVIQPEANGSSITIIAPGGSMGAQGITGPVGFTGPIGGDGFSTNTGASGPTGPFGTGPTGPAGFSSNTGATGPIGPQGPLGISAAYGNIYYTLTTSITITQGVYSKIIGTTTAGPLFNMTSPVEGRLTYTGSDTSFFNVFASASLEGASNNNEMSLKIYKNGADIGPSSQSFVRNTSPALAALDLIVELSTNDFLEVYFTNLSESGSMTVQCLNLSSNKITSINAGPTGPMGPQGFATNTGATGSSGAIGSIGNTGPAGFSTNTGATGPIGPTGAAGSIGINGISGSSTNTGSTGSSGIQGITGTTGPVAIPLLFYAESENESSTTSTTFQLKVNLTFTAEAADYYIGWTSEIKLSGQATQYGTVRLQLDGVTDINNTSPVVSVGLYNTYSGFKIITLAAGSRSVNIEYAIVTATEIFTQKSRINAYKVIQI